MKKTVLNLRKMGFVLVAATAMLAFSCGGETTEEGEVTDAVEETMNDAEAEIEEVMENVEEDVNEMMDSANTAVDSLAEGSCEEGACEEGACGGGDHEH